MLIKKYAVIVAGGSGNRMKSIVPKQFLEVNGKSLIYYSAKAFLDAYKDLIAIIILPKLYIDQAEKIFSGLPLNRIQIVEGGETRFHSVKNGLLKVEEESIVWVHDGVRCMINQELIHRCGEHAMQYGNAVPAVHATDSIRIAENETNKSIDRNQVYIIQTPQTFKSKILIPAFKKDYDPLFTDEASVVEAFGEKIHLVDGDYQNIKVTRPIDLKLVEFLLNQ